MFLFARHRDLRDLPSFPTRRSSDLPFTEADRKVSDIVQQYWVNFARTANPNGGKLPNWPKFDGSARPFLEFTKDGPVVHRSEEHTSELQSLRHLVCRLLLEKKKARY